MGDKEKNEYIEKNTKTREDATSDEIDEAERYRKERRSESEEKKEKSVTQSQPTKKTWTQRIMSKFGKTPEQKAQRQAEREAYQASYNKAKIKQWKKKGRYAARQEVWNKKRRFGDINTNQLIGGMGGRYGGVSDWDILGNSPRRKQTRRSDWDIVVGSGFGGKKSSFGSSNFYNALGLNYGKPKKKQHKGRRLIIRY